MTRVPDVMIYEMKYLTLTERLKALLKFKFVTAWVGIEYILQEEGVSLYVN